ncbi:hypothetical protein BAY61_14010 [Prauserella marina]|uniref:Sigma 54 modulation/S30EA ribosomal protein C terminus n=1 Tax=Prauserella marina TaxID=530584 RepID=A0A222VZ87_9PSEU|nr:sigma 54 modulation/S30EA ribosomal C-terminal domain-containing protein [Prauserella marina]ASR39268.1 hypothetical protein BAY61_14010 [Prauserella marina]PWV84136.1 sigma 54 modulation/S30EA-like ribosomal protein [Prauserella marina]SDC29547.1 Sigma 54 modulation/S30EA ribosomal protein C terminus [Prauserella marina]
MSRQGDASVANGIVVHTRGEVLDGAKEYVRKQLTTFARRLPARLDAARVKLTAFTKPSAPVPALAQANLQIEGRPVRAQVAAPFFTEAAGLLRARLKEQIAMLTAPRTGRPWDGAAPLGPATAKVTGRREIVRHKTYELTECAPGEATFTMDLMDYDFYLFTDSETGEDSVVYRVGPTGYKLARLASLAPPAGPAAVPLTVNVHPVPHQTPAEAAGRLDETALPFTFFLDSTTSRGAVVYRRYDGHYGHLAPR